MCTMCHTSHFYITSETPTFRVLLSLQQCDVVAQHFKQCMNLVRYKWIEVFPFLLPDFAFCWDVVTKCFVDKCSCYLNCWIYCIYISTDYTCCLLCFHSWQAFVKKSVDCRSSAWMWTEHFWKDVKVSASFLSLSCHLLLFLHMCKVIICVHKCLQTCMLRSSGNNKGNLDGYDLKQ